MTADKMNYFKKSVEDMAEASLRCVAFTYWLFDLGEVPDVENRDNWNLPENELILLGIVGIKDPCRPGVKDAVELCANAGVKVRMVTGDNIQTAKAIALECGILDPNVSATEPTLIGQAFRLLSEAERDTIADKISGTSHYEYNVEKFTCTGSFSSGCAPYFDFRGKNILRLNHETVEHAKKVKNTFIFNTFVFSQVFNEFNARKLDEMNIFKGMTKNHLFMGIIGVTILLQVLIVEFQGKFTSTVRLNWKLWLVSLGIGFISWPLAVIGKLIPVPRTNFKDYFGSCSCRRHKDERTEM